MLGITVGGVAVRITAEALSSGSVRLKRITAKEFLDPEILQASRGASGDDPNGLISLVFHPYPAAGSTSPVHAQLRILPTMVHQSQVLDTSPPPSPPLHCELCGLGAWLRGQGAVPGVHWVQLWRGGGGALRLRLCDGKPTALPGEEAEAVQQQLLGTGAPEASAEAAAADAAAQLVGPAAQAVADAAAPWQLHAPTCTAPCMPPQAAWPGCLLGAAGAGADGVGSAARSAPNGDHRVLLPTAPLKTGGGGGSGPVIPGVAGRDSGGADCHGLVDAAPPHPSCGGDKGSGGRSRSLSPLPVPPPPVLPAVPTLPPPPPLLSPPPSPPFSPAQQAPRPTSPAGAPALMNAPATPQIQTAAAFGSAAAAAATAAAVPAAASREFTVRITAECGRHIGWLSTEALELWPDACHLQFGQAAAVTLHPKDQPATLAYKTTVGLRLSAKLVRHDATTFALIGLGQADDVLSLWRDHTGTVWVGLSHVHSEAGQGLQQLGQQQRQDGGGAAAARRPLSSSILTGNVGKTKVRLRTDEVDSVLAPSLSQGHSRQLKPREITVHVEGGTGGGSSGDGEVQQGQQQESKLTVWLRCFQPAGTQPKWYLSSVYALLKALGAVDGDTVQLQCMSDGRLVIWRAAQHLYRQHKQLLPPAAVPLAACPSDSILIGVVNSKRMNARIGAVRALWPEIASRLELGQSTEVEVHAAVADAGIGPLCPFRVTLKLSMYQSPTWQLTGCGALFRALGAQTRDAICMWRSPGDGRLMAGVQPRGGSHRPGEEMQQVQEQQQQQPEQQAHVQQGQEEEQQQPEQQGQGGDGSGRLRHKRARERAVQRKYVEYAMLEESDGEGVEEEEEHEEWRSGDGDGEGPLGRLGDGLWRPSKRARAAARSARRHGGPSATQQQQQQQQQLLLLTGFPAGSILVGHKYRTMLQPRASAVRALWPNLAAQLASGQSAEVEVHVAEGDDGGQAMVLFRVMLRLQTRKSTSPLWRLTHCGHLFRALGAQERDAVIMWRSPGDGRLMAGVRRWGGMPRDGKGQQQPGQEATQQQQAQGQGQHVWRPAFPDGSTLVGRKHGTQLEVLLAAVKALWPDLAGRWVIGQSAEVEVHAAAAGAGGQALGPFRVVLKLEWWPSKPAAWRLSSCGPLFRALGAQDRDLIYMWRSPGDGRLMAGVQPRGGVRGGGKPKGEVQGAGKDVQVGQRGAGLGRARGRVRQVCDKHEGTDEEDVWQGEDEEEDEEEGEEAKEEGVEESSEVLGYGRETRTGGLPVGEGWAGEGCSVLGGGWGRKGAGLGLGGDYEAADGEEEGEEEEEEEEPGVNWWAREVRGEFGFGEDAAVGEQEEDQA